MHDVLVRTPLVLELRHPVVQGLQEAHAELPQGAGRAQVQVWRAREGRLADQGGDLGHGLAILFGI